MNIRLVVPCLTICLASRVCSAAISCSDLEPASPQFSNKLASVGQQAGISNARFSQYHRQAILDLCSGQEARVEDLIDQGRVTAREIGAIKRTLVISNSRPTSAPAVATTASVGARATTDSPNVIRKPIGDEAAEIDRAIDQLFTRWSQTWCTDRYVTISAHISELMTNGSDYLVQGTFSFIRYGSRATIPFASVLKHNSRFVVMNLCYNDTTTGMTDCTSSGQSSASSRFMGAIIIGGIVAGLSNNSSSNSSSGVPAQSMSKCGGVGDYVYERANCYNHPVDGQGRILDYAADQ